MSIPELFRYNTIFSALAFLVAALWLVGKIPDFSLKEYPISRSILMYTQVTHATLFRIIFFVKALLFECTFLGAEPNIACPLGGKPIVQFGNGHINHRVERTIFARIQTKESQWRVTNYGTRNSLFLGGNSGVWVFVVPEKNCVESNDIDYAVVCTFF